MHRQKIDDSAIIGDIVTIGQSMLFEVDADDIEELLEDHCIELTTEELEHLQNEHEKYWLITFYNMKRINNMSQLPYLNE